MLEWMGLNFYYYDGLQPEMRAGIINEHESTINSFKYDQHFSRHIFHLHNLCIKYVNQILVGLSLYNLSKKYFDPLIARKISITLYLFYGTLQLKSN